MHPKCFLSEIKGCYVMYIMLCYVMLCYIMLCYIILRYVTLRSVMLCYAMLQLIPVVLGKQTCEKPQIKLCCLNARSVRNKAEEIAEYICENGIDVCAITETWLSERAATEDKIVLGNLTPTGYRLFHVPRAKTQNKARGGGVAVLYRDHLKVQKQDVASQKSFECIEVLLTTGAGCTRLAVIYRPPLGGKSGCPTKIFLNEFHHYIDSHATTNGDLLLVGDFNFHYRDQSNSDSTKFKDVPNGLNLHQHVQDVTHDKGHLLDLVITRNTESVKQ